jgi:hypothetical protein
VVDVFTVLSAERVPGRVVAVLGGRLNGACVAEFLAHKGYEVLIIKRTVPISEKGGFISRKMHS